MTDMDMRTIYKNRKIKIKKSAQYRLSMIVLAFFVLLPQVAFGRTFDPNNIITDDELTNKNTLTKTAIQVFLERENSGLATFSQIINGVNMKASDMIWQVSQQYGINPEFILTDLEKEQGLIQKTAPSAKSLDWATGYSCYGGSCKEAYRGFYNQIDATAQTQQIYWSRPGQFSFNQGQTTITYDGFAVTPTNKATANLYIYTPYVGNSPEFGVNNAIGGNRLFWRIWNRYFPDQKFLDGQIIQNGSDYWLIQNNQKRKFASAQLFLKDHTQSDAIIVGPKDVAAYPDGPAVLYAENTLVKSAASGQLYLLAQNQKRPVLNSQALALLNNVTIAVTSNDIPSVSEDTLASYTLGPAISETATYPQGKLFQDETGAIWLVQDGLKHVVDPLVWQINFNSKPAEPSTTTDLDTYPTGAPVLLKDGTFVTNNGKYYLISQGARMLIADPTIFDRVFGPNKRASAVAVSDALLGLHAASDVIDYIDDTVTDAMVPNEAARAGTFIAEYKNMQPNGLILNNGQSTTATVTFTNTGTATWQPSTVWLVATDKDKDSSSFGVDPKIQLNEGSVGPNQTGSFTLEFTAPPTQTGVLNQQFTLYYSTPTGPAIMTSASKFIIVKPGVAAQVVSENFPVSVSRSTNKKIKLTTVTVKIKNISSSTWLTKKTALEITDDKGNPSKLYDPKDWVKRNVAATAVLKGKTKIKPGEIATFTFTLDGRGLKRGVYPAMVRLHLLDQNKYVYLDGADNIVKQIQVQ